MGYPSGLQQFFLPAGESVSVGWYAGSFNIAQTATFAAFAYGPPPGFSSGDFPTDNFGYALRDILIQSGPLQVSIDEVGNKGQFTYIMRWVVSNLSTDDVDVVALWNITSGERLTER